MIPILFKPVDFIAAPICFVILLMIFSIIVKKYKNEEEKRLFLKAFYFKMIFSLLFTAMCSFYYRGGDTSMYYECTQRLHKAVSDNGNNYIEIFLTKRMHLKSSLLSYFIYTG